MQLCMASGLLRLLNCIVHAMQVVVLGAGYDTTWFQLAQGGQAPARYLELDHLEVGGAGGMGAGDDEGGRS